MKRLMVAVCTSLGLAMGCIGCENVDEPNAQDETPAEIEPAEPAPQTGPETVPPPAGHETPQPAPTPEPNPAPQP